MNERTTLIIKDLRKFVEKCMSVLKKFVLSEDEYSDVTIEYWEKS